MLLKLIYWIKVHSVVACYIYQRNR